MDMRQFWKNKYWTLFFGFYGIFLTGYLLSRSVSCVWAAVLYAVLLASAVTAILYYVDKTKEK